MSEATRVGLIAGNGRFPFLVAEEVRRSGGQAVIAGIREETDPAIEKLAHSMAWFSLGELQKVMDFFHKEQVTTALMAGQVKHFRIFSTLKFDLRAIKLMAGIVNKKTDTILGAVAAEFEKEGIHLLPSHHFLKQYMPAPGLLAGPSLSKEEQSDVEFGRSVAKQIAGLDIGQTVAVKGRAVLAVESIEGTDECIRRAAQYGGEGITVVKVAKPNQDWRFDLPVIGPKTIEVMAGIKARVLAVESGATLIIDRETVAAQAKQHSISIIVL